MEFDHKNLLELRKLSLEELETYYCELRKYHYEQNESIKGIELRRKINKLVLLILKINRILLKQKLEIIDDKRYSTPNSKIFAVTHVGRYDIEMSCEVIKDSNYLLMGDPGEVYRNFDGLILYLKGVVFVDTANKLDRKIGEDTCIKILKQGGNILIFPEGAWNITENEVVMKLFNGTVRMARETNSDIIPIAIEQYGKNYYANIGKNINITNENNKSERELSDSLRDTLCTLKWEIWDKFPLTIRKDLPKNASELYLNQIMSETEDGYTVEEINRTKYHDFSIISPDEVFDFQKKLIPSPNNAFLLKNIH